ncbi:ubiquitin carboxyl-terminal hydrolase 38-like [Babylonia areolata]|uniref:ubiquitin carboxyl-terminal hydrolase 38-like n=1 Tax=Babylonia areolata TaxID=304850 RepID=UPI003FD3F9CA
MGTWMRRHRTKYVFNHEVEGMDHVLESVLAGSQTDAAKRQVIDGISLKGHDQHPSSDVRAVLNLALNWALQGHSELQMSSGFKLWSSWSQHHVGSLEAVLTRDLLTNLLTRPPRNHANLPLLLSPALALLQHSNSNGHAKAFQQLLKVIDSKAPTFLQESGRGDLSCLKNLLQLLAAFREGLPKGGEDLAARLVSPVLRCLASCPVPESAGQVQGFIRDVSTVTEILQQTWGGGGGGGQSASSSSSSNGGPPGAGNLGLLQDCLKELFKILSAVDDPEPSPCLGALAGLFPTEVVQAGIRTLVSDSRTTDAGVGCMLQRLLDWLVWPTCGTADVWVITLLKELATASKYPILVSVTESKVEQVMEKVRYAAVRQASFNILSHMLLSFQHSSLPFHKILPMVPDLLEVLDGERGEGAAAWRTKVCQLIHSLMFLHTGFPDLYDPIVDLIKDVPCPSTEEISQRLAESRWPVLQNGTSTPSTEGSSEVAKKSDTGKVGLANLGNTCYMNSVLQTLFMCDEFRCQTVLRSPSQEEKLLSELQHVFATLLLSKRPAWKPRQFLEASRPSWFHGGHQQDCSEFLKYLLDQIHEQQLRSINRQIEEKEIVCSNGNTGSASSSPSKGKSPPKGKQPSPTKKSNGVNSPSRSAVADLTADVLPDSTIVRQAFGFKVQSTYRCLACQQESQRVEDFLDIPLAFPETGSSAASSPISQKTLVGGGSHVPQGAALKQQDSAAEPESRGRGKVTHLSQLLGHYLTPEPLVGDNQYHCDRCEDLKDGERTICLLESPQYLILILLRFAFDTRRQIRSKVFREVTCPRTLAVPVARNNNGSGQKNATTTTTTPSPAVAKRWSRLLRHLKPNLPPDVSPSHDNLQLYGLCSVIVHSGPSSECGHYYCYARHSEPQDVDSVLDSLDRAAAASPVEDMDKSAELEEDFLEDKWCLFNDERVSHAAYTSFSKLTQRYPSDTPYMLVYKKLSLDSQKAPSSSSPEKDRLRKEMREAVFQDNTVFEKEQDAAKEQQQTGRSRSLSNTSITLDSWLDHTSEQASSVSPTAGQDGSTAKYRL